MKRTNNKLWALLLAVLALVALCAVTAFATVETGTCGDNLTWEYDTETKTLTISGTGEMYNYYDYSDSPWMSFKEEIQAVEIENGVTSIDSSAFYGCTMLKDIVIPDSVIRIGEYAFYGCTALESVELPEGIDSLPTCAFYNCSSLKSITIPDSLTGFSGWGVFYGCSSLESLVLPASFISFNGDERHFSGCNNLKSLVVAEGNPVYHSEGNCIIETATKELVAACDHSVIPDDGSVLSIGREAFAACSTLQSITIPDGVTSIGVYAFDGCAQLENIVIPDSVTKIGHDAFRDTGFYNNEENWDNDALYVNNWLVATKEDLSGYFVVREGTTAFIDGVFSNRIDLQSVTVPGSVNSISQGTFENCEELQSVELLEGINAIEYGAFYACYSLNNISIPDSVTRIGWNAFYETAYANDDANWEDGVLYLDNWLIGAKSDLSGTLTVKEGTKGLAQSVFYECASLEGIVLPSSLDYSSIPFTDVNNLSNLTSVTFADGLKSLDFGMFTLTQVEDFVLPNSVESLGTISLTSYSAKTVRIGNGLKEIGYAAANGDLMTGYTGGAVVFSNPETVYTCMTEEEWNENVTIRTLPTQEELDPYELNAADFPELNWISDSTEMVFEAHVPSEDGLICTICGTPLADLSGYCGAEEDGKNLTWEFDLESKTLTISGTGAMANYPEFNMLRDVINKVVIEEGVTSIGTSAFSNCIALTDITIPDSVTHIDEFAFGKCTSLQSISLPAGLLTIGYNSFYNCTSLQRIAIPNGVTNIDSHAFENCTALETITIPDSVMQIGHTVFDNTAFYNNQENWDNGVLYISNWLIRVKEDTSSDINVREGTIGIGPGAFVNCQYIQNITIPDGVLKLGDSAFGNCSSLQSVSIPDSITSIERYTFYNCTSLQTIDIPNSVTSIGNVAFWNCSSLQSIVIPDGIEQIDAGTFTATQIQDFLIPNGVESIGMVALTSINAKTVRIGNGLKEIGYAAANGDLLTAYMNGAVVFSNPETIYTCMTEDEWNENVTIRTQATQDDLDQLYIDGMTITLDMLPELNWISSDTEMVFDSHIPSDDGLVCTLCGKTLVETSGYCGAEEGGENLTWVYDLNDKKLTISGEGAMADFEYQNAPWYGFRSDIETVVVETGVTSIGRYAFDGCAALEDVSLSGTVETLGYEAFQNCDSLESIQIPEGVKSIGEYCFYSCNALASVTIPGSVETVDTCVFAWCESLQTVVLSDGVKDIDYNAFYGCTSLESITLPDSLTRIAIYAFNRTAYVNNEANWDGDVLYLGNWLIAAKSDISGVLSVKEGTVGIAQHAFLECSNLEGIEIPASLLYAPMPFTDARTLSNVTSVTFADGVKRLDFGMFMLTQVEDFVLPNSVESLGVAALTSLNSKSVRIGNGLKEIRYGAANGDVMTDYAGGAIVFSNPEKVYTCMTQEEWNENVTIHTLPTQEEMDPFNLDAGDFPESNWISDSTEMVFDSHLEGAPEIENETAATCTEAGHYDKVVYCTLCNKELSRETIETDPATGHSIPSVKWNWSKDYKKATVKGVCPGCGETLSAEAIVERVAQEDGSTICTATAELNGNTYTDSKTIPAPYRCQMCSFYDKYHKVPFFGWIVTIVHFFVHLGTGLGK